jgi:phosphate transport system substrate-binding protein
MTVTIHRTLAFAAVTAAAIAVSGAPAEARDQIRIVGSSTVFPFATAVAEQFGKTSGFKTPVVESTGSGGGLKLFCAGVGVGHPDITNSSRRIKTSEVDNCAKNGVVDVTEAKIGFDGIVIANSKAAKPTELSLRQIWLALAKDVPADETGEKLVPNPYKKWSDIDAALPDLEIAVLGPPPTSGTRDAFVELAMQGGCKTFPALKALRESDKKRYKAICHAIREDGAYIEAGENDVLIVQKLVANPDALGIFGFGFLDQNLDKIRGNAIDGVEPDFETIADGSYPISRSMYFYVKNAHVGVIPGIEEFIAEFTSEKASGPEGYLADKGLIPLLDAERENVRERALSFAPLTM